ncbi:GNAT family N-acetyltransferase [Thermoleptolyngbya sp. C42_A2020_037]|uniref:GNAT family N-acetyltransferase n=1 Tax=Thermoleptolyngbya sp. C42_A2020_037 TaxID=2747799 RepID=UPI0019E56408|nr:GNAT family N-acetyltransferase [Thermoleptolyngbya sp. C42_A2020_037]MBF2083844.1 GNAT family N-acetyltransferase [Thermoleptolyngbya sp. C42_A2020_037]
MMTLTERSVSSKADYQRLADFLNLCEAATYREYFFTAEELAHDATHPSFDPVGDRRLWEDATGQWVGVASLWGAKEPIDGFLDRHLSLRVHPDWRGRLEPEMLRWGESRLLQIGQARNLPTKLYVHRRDTEGDRLALFERNGFRYERRFLTEARSLLDPIPPAQLPAGFQIIDNTRRVPAQDWVALYNQTFIDHWGFHPLTVEQHEHWLSEADYRPDLDLIAVSPDGTLAGFCRCYISIPTNAHFGRREGWISSLGTRRGFRRMGLGRSLLLAGLHQLKAEGMDTALLGVDTQNPNAAYDLYHSVGFAPQFAWLSYAKVMG